MNINISGLRINNYYQKQELINTLLDTDSSKKSAKMDVCLINSISTEKQIIENKISSSIIDKLNFEYQSVRESKNLLSVCGLTFTKGQIPEANTNRYNEIKSTNNVVSFNNGKYYKYTDSNGKTHLMSCAYDRVKCPYSETLRGNHDNKSYNIGKFWNTLSRDGTYISMYYSENEQRKHLNDAGITAGIFTVKVGDHKQEYLYSKGNCGVAVPRSRYDADFEVIKNQGRFFKDYEVGSIFKIDGKEYALSENHTLDIPYGVDIYNMKRPTKKCS